MGTGAARCHERDLHPECTGAQPAGTAAPALIWRGTEATSLNLWCSFPDPVRAGKGNNSREVGVSPLREATHALLGGGLGRPLPFRVGLQNTGCVDVRLDILFEWLATGGCKYALQ